MIEGLLAIAVVLLLACLALLVVLVQRRGTVDLAPALARLEASERGFEKLERALREEMETSRASGQRASRELREELALQTKGAGDTLVKSVGELARAQKMQLDGFGGQLQKLTESNEKRLEALRAAVETKLQQIQEDSTKKLDQMRETVNEKLQGVLEKRLGESFKSVSERLELVHKGLGEMQTLAAGVGDLKRVLTNVKTRGNWGEIQLETLLEQILTPEQYAKAVATKPGSAEKVDFAIRLPARGDGGEGVLWLPIDAKFPQDDYQRLVEASERGDPAGIETASRELEGQIKEEAKSIRDKYLCPPQTTDFALMFLPTESLYAEVVRRTPLIEQLQRQYRVVVAGPMTLAALLNSLQMGFQTLAISKRSSEVWGVLAGVQEEFGKFGDVLKKVKDKLDQAARTLESDVAVRSRAIERRLKDVKAIPGPAAPPLLVDVDPSDLLSPEPERSEPL